EQQCGKSPGIQSLSDRPVARAETARTTAMRERNDGACVARILQCPSQPDRRNPHLANLDSAPGFALTGRAICDHGRLLTRFGAVQTESPPCLADERKSKPSCSCRAQAPARVRFDRISPQKSGVFATGM